MFLLNFSQDTTGIPWHVYDNTIFIIPNTYEKQILKESIKIIKTFYLDVYLQTVLAVLAARSTSAIW